MRIIFVFSFILSAFIVSHAQNPFNFSFINSEVEDIIRGNYDPSVIGVSPWGNNPDRICCTLAEEISEDSLYVNLLEMTAFGNRNTYSDTVSNSWGIGAARRWAEQKFLNYSSLNDSRMKVGYFQFEMPGSATCGPGTFRNVLAVLPGSDTTDKSIVIVEAHLDSRCEDRCSGLCNAEGADDNGSGSVLVMELARLMSRFDFPSTIVFMLTVGEEQGLLGAAAFSQWALDNGIEIRAVLNNDIVGGIWCGETSSPPSCSSVGSIDSTQVRIFSSGLDNSPHKNLARYVKMIYDGKMKGRENVPMTISILNPEDRTGRGGDHIPFRQRGFAAIRFTSANEHGNANVTDTAYHDRQHTGRDIIGVDTDNDQVIDSFFVSFSYLRRNTLINGIALAALASGGDAPTFSLTNNPSEVSVTINTIPQYSNYQVMIRETGNEFAAVYETDGTTSFQIPHLEQNDPYHISIAGINPAGYMSVFSDEISFTSFRTTLASTNDTVQNTPADCSILGISKPESDPEAWISLSQNSPNPFEDESTIMVTLNDTREGRFALWIYNITGSVGKQIDLELEPGDNLVQIERGNLSKGVYFYALKWNDRTVQTKQMVLH